jgi:hypothetical protein
VFQGLLVIAGAINLLAGFARSSITTAGAHRRAVQLAQSAQDKSSNTISLICCIAVL